MTTPTSPLHRSRQLHRLHHINPSHRTSSPLRIHSAVLHSLPLVLVLLLSRLAVSQLTVTDDDHAHSALDTDPLATPPAPTAEQLLAALRSEPYVYERPIREQPLAAAGCADPQGFAEDGNWLKLRHHYGSHLRGYGVDSRDSKHGLVCTPRIDYCEVNVGLLVDVPAVVDQGTKAHYRNLRQCMATPDFPAHDAKTVQQYAGLTLTTWLSELQGFATVDNSGEVPASSCDVLVKEPTLIIKPDAHANLYHAMYDLLLSWA